MRIKLFDYRLVTDALKRITKPVSIYQDSASSDLLLIDSGILQMKIKIVYKCKLMEMLLSYPIALTHRHSYSLAEVHEAIQENLSVLPFLGFTSYQEGMIASILKQGSKTRVEMVRMYGHRCKCVELNSAIEVVDVAVTYSFAFMYRSLLPELFQTAISKARVRAQKDRWTKKWKTLVPELGGGKQSPEFNLLNRKTFML